MALVPAWFLHPILAQDSEPFLSSDSCPRGQVPRRGHGDAACRSLLAEEPLLNGRAVVGTRNRPSPHLPPCWSSVAFHQRGPEVSDREASTKECRVLPRLLHQAAGAPSPAVAQYFLRRSTNPSWTWWGLQSKTQH